MDAMEQMRVFSTEDVAQNFVKRLYDCGFEAYTVCCGNNEIEVRWNEYQ